MWLIGAIGVSMLLHVLILYVPALSLMFSVCISQNLPFLAGRCYEQNYIGLIAYYGTVLSKTWLDVAPLT